MTKLIILLKISNKRRRTIVLCFFIELKQTTNSRKLNNLSQKKNLSKLTADNKQTIYFKEPPNA